MYIILNNRLERIGTLSNHSLNGTPFYNDVITQQIADDDQQMSIQSVPDTTNSYDKNGNTKNWGHTLDSIFVPYGYPDSNKIAEGNSLAYQDPNNGHWYVMRLTTVTDATDASGNHYKQATGVNLCIWKLGKTVHYPETIKNASSRKAFSALFDDTGWYFDPTSELVGGSADISFDGTSSSQSMLQQLCQTYGAEIDAYVLFPKSVKMGDGRYYSSDFQVAMKCVDVVRHLGADNGNRIVYGRNATNIQRTVVDDNLYTRLYVYGKDGNTCACSITHNEPYVQDEVANTQYNPALGDNAENYLEGAITSQTMKNPERLAKWGLKQLKIFNHPRANYTVGVSNMLNSGSGNKLVMDANLGDTFRVIDYKMDPVLTAQSRVIRKQLSFANPTQNQITLGEYTTVNVVTPKFIDDLQNGEYNQVNSIISEIQRNPGALSCTIDKPDGCTWHYGEQQKRFIAHVYVMGKDITNLIDAQGFVWQLRQQGQFNPQFAKDHAGQGQTLILNNNIKLRSDITSGIDSSAASESAANASMSSSTSNNNSSNTSDSDNVDPDDDTPSGDDDFDINSDLAAPEDVTGEIRLLIDTAYITDQQETNFNTNRIHHLFTVGEWTDLWGDNRVAALQYINYNPSEQLYYASLVYRGRNRPRNSSGSLIGRSYHTEIARLDTNGNYKDSMIMLFSHHNSNFGLDYSTPGGPYIWTTFQSPSNSSEYWLARLNYQPGKVISLNDLSNNNKIMRYSEPGCMTYYDNSSDMVLFSHDDTNTNPSHPVEFYKAQDLLNNHNNAKPTHSIRLTDYGFEPKIESYSGPDSQDNSTQQTFQSSCLHYPYYCFDSGNVNMSDQRMVYCIDISSGHKIFSKPLDMDDFNLSQPNNIIGKNPGNYIFAEPETFNWIIDSNGDLVFLLGLNVGYENDRTNKTDFTDEGIPTPDYKHYELLYKVGFDLNNGKNNQPDHSENGHPQT